MSDRVWLVQGVEWGNGSYRIEPGCQTLGRSPECGFHISHHLVSRVHAEIEHTGTSLIIRDLGSRNGTFVNGMSVKEREFFIGDRLRLSVVSLEVTSGTAVAPKIEDLVTTPMISEKTANGQWLQDDGLTLKEREVLPLLLQGRTQKEIADELGLSPNTVHSHTEHIYGKYGVGSHPELLALFLARTAEWKQLMAGTKRCTRL